METRDIVPITVCDTLTAFDMEGILLAMGFVLSVMTCGVYCGVSTKMDFGNEEDQLETVSTNTTTGSEDVEVKHTIYLSTKLKNNNNRRGIHGSNDGDGILTYNIGQDRPSRRQDSGEVPVMNGYMAVDTTQLRTPDSRYKHKNNIYPDAVFINRNVRDELDVYPNVATNPAQWKPSNFFNNINWYDTNRENYNLARRNDGPLFHANKNRKISNDGMKEFYCKRCRELSGQGATGCIQRRSNTNPVWNLQTTSTTPKIKIDGKIAKLN